ncbi:VC0807 family protein [Streptomyces sp. NPDC046805]|uniref:VC0807 family protein n=1 Tax=Streptomyces sp. NPDC046805 TaxID=3155134 RepID=UPI0033C829ED
MTTNAGSQGQNIQHMKKNFVPLMVDVAVPIGSYYLLKDVFGLSTFAALAWSSVVPALRTVWSVVRERKLNGLAALILGVNVVSLLLSFVSGDPRLMLVKDSGVSSTVGIGILVSVALGRPMMTNGIKPFLLQGDPDRAAAWERLQVGSDARALAFRSRERLFSVIWGVVLVAECAVRIVGAYTLPVDTMVGLNSVILMGAIALGIVGSRFVALRPMGRLFNAELAEVKEVEAVKSAAAQDRQAEPQS